MKRSIGPGRHQPGLLIPVFLLVLVLSGCAAKTHKITHTSSPQPTVSQHQVNRSTETASKQETVPQRPEAGPEEANEPDTPMTNPGDEAKAAEAKVDLTAKNEAGSVEAAEPTVVEPSVDVHPSFTLKELRQEFKQASTGSKQVALTFDAGASPKPTPAILAALKRYGIHCTFFLTGKWMEANPELTRRITEEGHELGNHSYSHPDFRKLSDDEIREQLERMEQIAEDIAGVTTKPFFRPPFGGRDKRVKEVAAEAGYRSIYWSVDSWDGYKKGITAEEIRERVLCRVKGGDIVLMHCGSAPTAEALPSIIEELQARSYRLVKVSQLL